MLMQKLLASAGEESKLYSDDVFQAFTRTGTGADVAVTTGIDMTKGYMLWSKGRSGATDHAIYDSARGLTYALASNTTAGQNTQATGLKAVSATGHTIGSLAKMNTSAATYVDFVFRKAPKFFDVVTYTGNGAHQQVSHSLGVQPGLIIAKAINATSAWSVWHRGATGLDATAISGLSLNVTNAPLYNGNMDGSQMRATSFRPSTFYDKDGYPPNANGVQYVAYLFAHDPSAGGIIQCGSYSGNGSATGPIVNLGWEPQYLMVKNSSGTGNWQIIDNMRGMPVGSADATLQANGTGAESSADYSSPTATGFQLTSTSSEVNTYDSTYIYLAIRRPNKPPTTGTEVYNAIARTGTGAAATVTGVGFAPDLVMVKSRNAGQNPGWIDRLRGMLRYVYPASTSAEETGTSTFNTFTMDGGTIVAGTEGITNVSGNTYINHFFKRAPGFFDVVCYAGTGVPHLEPHGLGVVPELTIIKRRGAQGIWCVHPKSLGVNGLLMESTGAATGYTFATYLNSSTATGLNFGGLGSDENTQNQIFVAYLFASLPGISKVGSYTGNGSSQTINCGFTTGARFILIKRTDSTGDWLVADTTRGLVSGGDPRLSLNTAAAEVTGEDWIDPDVSGFIVNQVAATNINVSGGQYIFLAIA